MYNIDCMVCGVYLMLHHAINDPMSTPNLEIESDFKETMQIVIVNLHIS